jgi:hypothetical protein
MALATCLAAAYITAQRNTKCPVFPRESSCTAIWSQRELAPFYSGLRLRGSLFWPIAYGWELLPPLQIAF